MEEKGLHQKSYTRVIEYIKQQIRSGKLAVGSKLPTERDLSAKLGISRNSVREAIRTLDTMGIVTSQQGAGNYLAGNFEYHLAETMSMMVLLDQTDDKQISKSQHFILWEACHDMLRSLVTRDKELAYKAINMYFDMLDFQETSLKR